MGNRFSTYFGIQVIVIIIVGSIAGCTALTAMGAVGGVGIGVAPEFSFGLVKGVVCPEGTLEYYSVQRSYHRPGESEPHLECVNTAGDKADVLLQGIVALLGLTFVATFAIIFLPMWAVVSWLATRVMKSRSSSKQEAWQG